MRILILSVGKTREPALANMISDYVVRAERYWPIELRAVREEGARLVPPDAVKTREAERLEVALPERSLVVVCDEAGQRFTSRHFATWLQRQREQARDVTFVIGGAFGIADSLKRRADVSLALACWTLPHDLARLVLAEQLYRAGTIVRREPYHK